MIVSVASTIQQFNLSNLSILQHLGYEVHVAANFKYHQTWSAKLTKALKEILKSKRIIYHQIDFTRTFYDIKSHYQAYQQIQNLFHKYSYSFIHCQTPIAGVVSRLAAKRLNLPSIYTAHGFHFFSGAPWRNWLLFYPIEWYLSYYTEILITINREDYILAKGQFYMKTLEYLPGVGINLKEFQDVGMKCEEKRRELQIPPNATVFLSVGELNENKNHEIIIRALGKIKNPNLYYIICGKGEKKESLENLAKKAGIGERVKLLGFRTDVKEIYAAADIYVHPSRREGLPVSVMEAMASGLPCIVSDIRGNRDLIINNKGGILVQAEDMEEWKRVLFYMVDNKKLWDKFRSYNRKRIQNFSLSNIEASMSEIYKEMDRRCQKKRKI